MSVNSSISKPSGSVNRIASEMPSVSSVAGFHGTLSPSSRLTISSSAARLVTSNPSRARPGLPVSSSRSQWWLMPPVRYAMRAPCSDTLRWATRL